MLLSGFVIYISGRFWGNQFLFCLSNNFNVSSFFRYCCPCKGLAKLYPTRSQRLWWLWVSLKGTGEFGYVFLWMHGTWEWAHLSVWQNACRNPFVWMCLSRTRIEWLFLWETVHCTRINWTSREGARYSDQCLNGGPQNVFKYSRICPFHKLNGGPQNVFKYSRLCPFRKPTKQKYCTLQRYWCKYSQQCFTVRLNGGQMSANSRL